MKKKVNRKELIKEIKKNIPDEIKILYGKYYFFCLLLIIFLGLLFPLFIFKFVSFIFSIVLLLLLFVLYILMIVDVIKHKNNFESLYFVLSIFITIFCFIVSFCKLF